MGFWSGLGTALGNVGGSFIGDPGLGSQLFGGGGNGVSPAGNVAQAAGSIEAARAKALVYQAQLGQGQDRNAQSRYLNSLAGLKQNAAMPQQLASNSVRGDVLANAQDANISGLPSYIHMGAVSGGLRPSLMSKNTRALGGQMSRDALAHSISGDMNAGAPPPLTPLPTASGLDKGLSGVALGGGLLNALGNIHPGGGGGVDAGSPQHAEEDTRQPDTNVGDPGIDPEYAAWLQSQQEGVG